MYVSTFYSYKGGVGRTMALINVAVLLAQSGKRVLIVDFDLEAPGIPSFDLFRCADNQPGVVDYVCAYRDSGRSPNVDDFIVKCDNDGAPPIWLMPAGRHTKPGYAEKLYSIDWKDIYDNQGGFLMFEDLRLQWSEHAAGFDYVLIDSRTGHTDVGGICTRQLPDAVVVMFLPNEQNIEGLKPIVTAIRDESGIRGEIELHFCPSNVPDLDDEDDILSDMIQSARAALGHEAAMINHYNSLDLLNQPAFAACRPNSKLARQYGELMNAVISHNFEDATGAELTLKRMPERYEAARRDGDGNALQKIEGSASRIAALHPDNGKLAWLLSILYSRMGAVEDELEALGRAIDNGFERSRSIIRRVRALSSLNRQSEALEELSGLLNSGTATAFEILPAIDLMRALKPEGWLAPIQDALDQLQANGATYQALIQSLLSEREKLPLAVRIAQRALPAEADTAAHRKIMHVNLVLSLIGLGRFELAMETISPARAAMLESHAIEDVFNYAIAEWGSIGAAPQDLFLHTLALMGEQERVPDANLLQCRALAEAVVGETSAARHSIDRAKAHARRGARVFSCWRYLDVSGRMMLKDLSVMEEQLEQSGVVEPAFFQEVRRLVE